MWCLAGLAGLARFAISNGAYVGAMTKERMLRQVGLVPFKSVFSLVGQTGWPVLCLCDGARPAGCLGLCRYISPYMYYSVIEFVYSN